ncbi:imm11 family protein [Bacillus rhizoplanae]|uniref:imm11 family protein n=1 Tax=Bacillus rhizoplanae TaxID=2880966 RepID=UPI003D230901
MKIYELRSSVDNYESFQLLNFDQDHEKYFDGEFDLAEKLSNSWGEILIECVEEGNQSDCPHFWGRNGVLLVSEKAKSVLEPLIGNNIEFLPLIHNVTNEFYYAINVLKQLDAIDNTKTVLKKLRSGLIVGCEKYSFIPQIVENENIFKVFLNKHVYSISVFVSDEFRNTILENDLKGFEFVEVWDSELNM